MVAMVAPSFSYGLLGKSVCRVAGTGCSEIFPGPGITMPFSVGVSNSSGASFLALGHDKFCEHLIFDKNSVFAVLGAIKRFMVMWLDEVFRILKFCYSRNQRYFDIYHAKKDKEAKM